MEKEPRTADVVEAFIATRRARGCSVKYEAWLRYTLGFLLRAHEVLPAAPEPLEAVLADLNLAAASKRDVWSAWRMLYRWAVRRLGVVDAMVAVEKPLAERKKVRTLSQVQVDQLLWANQRRGRDFALLLLLLDTGARIGEAFSLRWSDVGDSSVLLSGKTGEREVPVSIETVEALDGVRRGDCLWVGEGGPLTLDGLQAVVQRALERADLSGGPHMLRHTFGRLYVMNGGDLFSLQGIMGHLQVTTTRLYVELDGRDVQKQHARFSPVAMRGVGRGGGLQLPLGDVRAVSEG